MALANVELSMVAFNFVLVWNFPAIFPILIDRETDIDIDRQRDLLKGSEDKTL